jgi:hypothetical protein
LSVVREQRRDAGETNNMNQKRPVVRERGRDALRLSDISCQLSVVKIWRIGGGGKLAIAKRSVGIALDEKSK